MVSKARSNSLKVAVGSPDNPLSWVWKLLVHRDDIYFGTRDTLGHFKVSLHKSGDWHMAFTRPLDPKGKNADRFGRKWRRPGELHPGFTYCVGVIVSPILPRRPFKNREVLDPEVKWVPMPPPNRVLFLVVVIVKAGIVIDPRLFVQDKLIGHLKKANGESVCLLVHERELTDQIVSKIHEIMRGVKISNTQEISEDSITTARALMDASDDQIGVSNPPIIFDVPLGWDNVVANKATSTPRM